MLKQELRQEIRNRKRQFSHSQLGELSLAVLQRLMSLPIMQEARTVLLYYSLPDEVNTHQLIERLAAEGCRILLPQVIDGENMLLREYSGKEDLKEGAFHIMEPCGKLFPESDYQKIDVAVVPGMSFDKQGNRLGRGKGYYDRMLQKMPAIYKIGICFDFQKTESLPTDEHDIRMDLIV